MITPSYSLTATERVLPRLALDFTTATLDPRVTFTRSGNTATVTDSSGLIVAINADLPRFDYNPSTLICNGLLIEESRTNELLNSLIDGTDLSTQVVVVTAAARTLSFYGTGQVVLSGAHSATVTGSGAYPVRTTLTFTPSVGALTLTVTGTVQFAQLELGLFETSFIPTAASQVTRTVDIATMTGTNFSDWFNASEGTLLAEANTLSPSTINGIFSFDNTTTSRIELRLQSSALRLQVIDASVTQASITAAAAPAANITFKLAGAYKINNFAAASAGGNAITDNAGSIPTVTRCFIGSLNGTANFLNGCIEKLAYYPQRLINAEVRAISK